MSKKITVFVGAIGGGGHGEQIVKALRLAGADRYEIIGGDASKYCPQFSMVDVPVFLPKADDPDYIEAVLHLADRYGVKAVFHGCEPELLAMHRNRDVFARKRILLPINPPDVIETCMDKERTASFLKAHNFLPPASMLFTGVDVVDLIERYPVIVKPSKGGGGSKDVFIAQDRKQLEFLGNYLDVENGTFLIQEYVGRFDEEYTVGVLHDLNGQLLHSIAIRRLMNSALNIRLAVRNKTDRKDLGEWLVVSSGVSHGEVRDFPEVRAQCEEISKAIGAKGPINIQCRFVDGKVRVFEINPRFSGTTSLRAMVGYNEPDILLRKHVLGESVEPRFSYGHGCIIRSLNETLLPQASPPLWSEL
jgi:carbamoyl-phosphate synthase large subunit